MPFPTVGQNTKIGKGALHFALFDDSDVLDPAIIFGGDAPAVGVSWEVTRDELFSSTEGPAVLADTQITDAKLTLAVEFLEHRKEVLERWLLALSSAANQSSGMAAQVEIDDVVLDRYYDTGIRRGTNVSVTKAGDSVPLESLVDYAYDSESGFLWVKTGGAIVAGDDLVFTADKPALTINRMSLGKKPIQYVRVWYHCNDSNQNGISAKDKYTFWRAEMSPSGEMALIGDGRARIPVTITVYGDTANHPDNPYGIMERVTG